MSKSAAAVVERPGRAYRRPGRRAPAALRRVFPGGVKYVAFARLVGHQIPQMADFGLSDAVDAAEPLLKAVRVPGEVVVDHQVGSLEVDAFAGGVGGDQD